MSIVLSWGSTDIVSLILNGPGRAIRIVAHGSGLGIQKTSFPTDKPPIMQEFSHDT